MCDTSHNNREQHDPLHGEPTVLEHVVGQRRPVRQLHVALDSRHHRAATSRGGEDVALDDILLVGPPAHGKSLLAKIVARELGTEAQEALGGNLATPGDVHSLLLDVDCGRVLLIDETHGMTPSAQVALYHVLTDRKVLLPHERQPYTLPPFTLIAATTDEGRLTRPLRERFGIRLSLEPYSEAEIAELLTQRARRCGLTVTPEAVERIAARSRRTPRRAIWLLRAALRTSESERSGHSAITAAHVRRMCRDEAIDAGGLGPDEQRYLRLLNQAQSPLPAHLIATRMNLPYRTISEVIEAELIRLGLVTKIPKGRVLTREGREYLTRPPEEADLG